MSCFEIFSTLKEDIRQLYLHFVHVQKDLDFELTGDMREFDGEEFRINGSLEKIDLLAIRKVQIPEEWKKRANSQAFNHSLVQLLGFNTVMNLEGHLVDAPHQVLSNDLAAVIEDVIANNNPQSDFTQEKSVIETELADEEAREAVWKLFEILNRQKVLKGQLNPEKFDSIHRLCLMVLHKLLHYEDWPNAARFIYHTQDYKTFRASGEVSNGKVYLQQPILKNEAFVVNALCTLIEVSSAQQDDAAVLKDRSRSSIFVEVMAKNMKVVEHLFDSKAKVAEVMEKVRLQALVTESPGASNRMIEIENIRNSLPDTRSLAKVFRIYNDTY